MTRRTKLEIYMDILKVLVDDSPTKLTEIMFKANVNTRVLKEYLNFLVECNLVKTEQISDKRVVYAITKKGQEAVQNFLNVVDSFVPPMIIKESKFAKEGNI